VFSLSKKHNNNNNNNNNNNKQQQKQRRNNNNEEEDATSKWPIRDRCCPACPPRCGPFRAAPAAAPDVSVIAATAAPAPLSKGKKRKTRVVGPASLISFRIRRFMSKMVKSVVLFA
jgi:hypothetical protein